MMQIYSIVNQKGGVGKTATSANLSSALSKCGYKVLTIDLDPQGNLTESLGYRNYDGHDDTIFELMSMIIKEQEIPDHFYIKQQKEGIDLIPSNISLADMDIMLVNTMSREFILKQLITQIKEKLDYDYILIDCMPSLGMVTINALVASDAVLIPVEASYLPIKGLQMLLRTIAKVRRQLNRKLNIAGIIFTLVDIRTNEAKNNIRELRKAYGDQLKIFDTYIPFSVRIKESCKAGVSIFSYAPKCKAAKAYENLGKELLAYENK